MEQVVLVIHIILALAIIGLVLIQRSEGGGLGIGGGSGGIGNLATAQGAANALTRLTSIFAAAFFITSLTLAWMAGHHSRPATALFEQAGPSVPLSGEREDGEISSPPVESEAIEGSSGSATKGEIKVPVSE